jgi:hypothetical protein
MDGFLWALQFPSPITPHPSKRNGGLNQILKRQTSRSHYGSKEEIRSFESKKKSRSGNTMLKGIRINNYRQKHYTENLHLDLFKV